MNDPQRDYYRVTSAGETFETRLAAIRDVLVPGSRIVDIGCNDGRMSLALLRSGHAAEAVGLDLENFVDGTDPRFRFVQTDLRVSGTSLVPSADAILCLNVVHHLLLAGRGFVRRFIAELLGRADTVLIDLGSLTETGPWAWRQLMARLWASDEEVADDLFAAAMWRAPLCTYRAQNGRRVLWKLSSRSASDQPFEVEQRYRRTIGQQWQVKRLVPASDEDEVPEGCCDEVIFHRLRRRDTNERFWSKRYLGVRDVEWRATAEREVIAFVRTRDSAAALPAGHHAVFGAIHPFDEALLRGRAVHYFDRHLLPSADQRRYERLMQSIFDDGPFAGLPLGVIADVQAIATPAGVRFVDFEPNHCYTALIEFLVHATPAQRADVLTAFWDVNPVVAASLPPAVRTEIRQALGTDLFRLIARERLRVERNRRLRAAVAGLRDVRPAAAALDIARAVRSEALRTRRNGPVVRLALRSLLARMRNASRR